MSIKSWPIDERPREKLLSRGAEALSDGELLAIFLRTGTKQSHVLDLAHRLMARFGNFYHLFHATSEEFCQEHGLGIAKYAELQAIAEMNRRYLFVSLKKKNSFLSPDSTKFYLRSKLAYYEIEKFACLWLDSKNRVISFQELFQGSLDKTHIYPREIVKSAIHHGAAAVIFAHNHPSGDVDPSAQDIKLTQDLTKTLRSIDVRVLDHIIVGKDNIASFVELGLL